jgi:uncharacterized protein (DUF433 family)
MHSKPVIRGRGALVDLVFGSLAGGMSMEELASGYGITREHVLAAIGYAARIMAREEVK